MDNLNQIVSYSVNDNSLNIGQTTSGTLNDLVYRPYDWSYYWQPILYPQYIHTEIQVDKYKKAFEIAKMLMKDYIESTKVKDFMEMVDKIAKFI